MFSLTLNKLISRMVRDFSPFSSTYVIIFPRVCFSHFPRHSCLFTLENCPHNTRAFFTLFYLRAKKMYFNFKLNCKQQQPAAGGVY